MEPRRNDLSVKKTTKKIPKFYHITSFLEDVCKKLSTETNHSDNIYKFALTKEGLEKNISWEVYDILRVKAHSFPEKRHFIELEQSRDRPIVATFFCRYCEDSKPFVSYSTSQDFDEERVRRAISISQGFQQKYFFLA